MRAAYVTAQIIAVGFVGMVAWALYLLGGVLEFNPAMQKAIPSAFTCITFYDLVGLRRRK